MKTRQIIPTLALLLILSTTATAVTPRHRHQPQTEQTAPASSTTQQNTQGQGNTIEAYSDTTDVDSTSSATASPAYDANTSHGYDYTDDHSLRSEFAETFGDGLLGGFAIFMVFMTVIIAIIAPIVIVALILRYLIKRHNQHMEMMEKELEAERAYEEQARKEGRPYHRYHYASACIKSNYSPEALMQRAITKITVGIGLALMFFFFDWDFAVGIGLLVACIGAGQYYSASRAAKRHQERPIEDADFEEDMDTDYQGVHRYQDMSEQPTQENKNEENK